MPARERAMERTADLVCGGVIELLVLGPSIKQASISSDELRYRFARNVEDHLVAANPRAPEAREILGPFDGTGVQQSIAARRVGSDGKVVTSGIGERDVRVLLHAEIATRGWLAIEGSGEHAMFDRHPLGPAVEKDVEAPALPRRDDRAHLIDGELDREHDPPRSEAKELRGAVLVHHIDGVVRDDVAAGPGELGNEPEVTAQQGQAAVEPLADAAPLLGSNDRRRAEAERDAAAA